MTDVAVPETTEGFSAEFVASLKKELAEKTASEASLKTRFAAYENRQRETLKSLQPTVVDWINQGMEEAGAEHAAELKPLQEFGSSLAEASNVDSALPLARMISCHSALFKRKTAEFSTASATAEELATANKTIDELKASEAAKSQRIQELESLANERQEVATKLSEQLSASGAMTEKFDFSKAAAREVNPPAGASDAPAASSSAPAAKTPMLDPLLAFVSGSGGGNANLMPSSSTHALLGGGQPSFY
jgi:chromosome segregation ATPase